MGKMPRSTFKLTRRRLLQHGAALGAASFFYGSLPLLAQSRSDGTPGDANSPSPGTPNNSLSSEHIGIIGAGLAGLVAAQQLRSQGMRVTVIEGRERIGGRAHTIRLGSTLIDTGAEWIPNDPRNPILELAKKFNLKTTSGETRSLVLYGLNNKRVPSGRVARLTQRFSRVLDQVRQQAIRRERRDQSDLSMADALNQTQLYRDLSPDEITIVDWLIARQITSTAGAELSKISLKSYAAEHSGRWYHGGLRRFDQGFGSLVNALAKDLNILLAHVVKHVQYTNQSVKVTTNAGAFDFDRLVVTLPLGVLQSNDVTFEPALPDWKRDAIGRLGIGHAQRLMMRFEDTFWPKQVEFLGSTAPPSDRFIDWTNLYRRARDPMLSLWSAGPAAAAMETESDETLTKLAMQEFDAVFGKQARPAIQVHATRWGQDPFSRGAWAYMPLGARRTDVEQLSKSLFGRVFFAGDATQVEGFHTAAAAVRSGVRAAQDIARTRSLDI